MSDRAIIGGALALSAALHLGGLALLPGPEAPAIEGGTASAGPATLGNSFRDLAQGSVAAGPAPRPDTLAPTRPVDRPPEPASTLAPMPQPVADAPAPAPSQVASLPDLGATAPVSAEPARPAAVAPAEAAARPVPAPRVTPVARSAQPPKTAAAATRAELQSAESAPPDAVVAAVEPPEVVTAGADTPRPAPRQERTARTPPLPAPPATRTATAPGAEQAERRGQDDGTETAANATRAAATEAAVRTEQGNAAASSYPGLVMRHLSRTPRPETGRRGAAVVGFELGAGGELRQAVILRSSGHEGIDRAAIEHLRRAAPFPAPPQGAERRFEVRYESRG
jgi:protein TonB